MAENVYLLTKLIEHKALSARFKDESQDSSSLFSNGTSFDSILSGLQAGWADGIGAVPTGGSYTVSGGAKQYEALIQSAGEKYGVDTDLIKAVMQTESGFRYDSVSSAGAQGLMQLMPGTAKYLGVADSFDPAQNIDGGTRYLAEQISNFGDTKLALAAYNCGPGRVGSLGITDSSDAVQYSRLGSGVRGYVDKVLSLYEAYKAESQASGVQEA